MLTPTVQGVYYVTRDTTVRIPGGLLGVSQGTEVVLVADKGDKILFTNGRDQFELSKSMVTNDPKAEAELVKKAQAAQEVQEKLKAQQNDLLIKQQKAEVEFLRTHPLATPTPKSTPVK